jgi:carbon storage regulator CsrA
MRRRAGESFFIGADIEIEVLEVCGAKVKLGILAPDEEVILRKEARITRDENIIAARSVRRESLPALIGGVTDLPLEKNTRTVLAPPDMTQ